MSEIWFDHAATRLFAVDHGTGRAIILLHGGLATHEACRRFAAPLDARFRVITPDLRGAGSSRYAGELTWDLLADDVAALARHLGITRAVVGGVSFGAGCAVRVALRHPELVAGLAVLHPAFAGSELGLSAAQQSAMQAMDGAGRRTLVDGIEALFPLLDALPAELRARGRALFATYDPASVAATTRFMASGAQPFDTAAELAAIAVPALVVPGVDPYHPAALAELYARHLPHCSIDHREFAIALADFVDQIS